MLERDLQRFFMAQVKKRHLGVAVKVECSSRRGWPDVFHAFEGGELRLIEFKTLTGKLSMHQIEVHEELRMIGHPVTVLATKKQIEEYLNGVYYYAHA